MISTSQKVRLILKLSGLSQEKLAQKIGVSFAALNAWLNERARPRTRMLARIDELYLEYTGGKTIPESELAAKKEILAQKHKSLPNPLGVIFVRKDIYDEFMLALTYHSNKIEGSTLTEPETAAILFDNTTLPDKSLIEQVEVKNHQAALEYLFSYLRDSGMVDETLVLTLHTKLMNGIKSDAGFYRRHPVRIAGANVPTANFLKVPELMKELMRDAHIGSGDLIAKIASFHACFEQIHPFSDGNGRIGRLLMHAMALRAGYPPIVIREHKRQLYYTYLQKAQMKGDQTLLEDFVCDGLLDAYEVLSE